MPDKDFREPKISKEEAIKVLFGEPSDLQEQIKELADKIDLILSALVMSQKDACAVAGINAQTVVIRFLPVSLKF